MSASSTGLIPRARVFVETWTPGRLGLGHSAITAMIYQTPQRDRYLADIRRAGELVATVTAPTLDAIRSELGARATSC